MEKQNPKNPVRKNTNTPPSLPQAANAVPEIELEVNTGGDRTITEENPAIKKLARAGRFGDTQMAHTTPGEIILPLDIQDEELMNFVAQKFEEYGIPMNKYVVQDEGTNPETGEAEYFSLGGLFKSILPAAASMIPGVGQIAGPVVGALMSGSGGSSGGAASNGASGGTTANLAALPQAAQADIARKKTNPFSRPITQLTVDTVSTPTQYSTPPLSQDVERDMLSENPQTGMREYFSTTDQRPTVLGTDMRASREVPRRVNQGLGDVIRGAFKGGSNGKTPPTPSQTRKGSGGGIPPMKRSSGPSFNPRTGKPEYAGAAAASPTMIGVKGQPAPTAGGTYNTNFVKTGAVDLTPFTNSGVPRVKGANNSTVSVPAVAETKPTETPVAETNPTVETQTATTPATKTAAPSYADEQYFGTGRNQRELDIQGLGYTGPFGRGVADAWLNSKYGTTDLNQIPRTSTKTAENNVAAVDPYKESLDRLQAMIDKYLSASQTTTNPQNAAATSVAPAASALSPYRPPRFRSRRFRGTYAPNFIGA